MLAFAFYFQLILGYDLIFLKVEQPVKSYTNSFFFYPFRRFYRIIMAFFINWTGNSTMSDNTSGLVAKFDQVYFIARLWSRIGACPAFYKSLPVLCILTFLCIVPPVPFILIPGDKPDSVSFRLHNSDLKAIVFQTGKLQKHLFAVFFI